MNFEYQIRQATEVDQEQMRHLLKENHQKPTIIVDGNSIYLLAESDSKIIGMIGAEISGNSALIRSTAVLTPWRNKGLGVILINTLFSELKEAGKTKLYLFSRDSGQYWVRFGFEGCSVQEVIDHLPDANQVVGYISDNSIWTDVAWHKKLKN